MAKYRVTSRHCATNGVGVWAIAGALTSNVIAANRNRIGHHIQ
jgi:hypothetical protein